MFLTSYLCSQHPTIKQFERHAGSDDDSDITVDCSVTIVVILVIFGNEKASFPWLILHSEPLMQNLEILVKIAQLLGF
jgi:hypothetical protein